MSDITVLMSVYKKDCSEYLDKALNSLYEQTLKPDEIILVKDGIIGEELLSIIKKWSTKLPLRTVGYDDNHGLAYAMNYGVQFIRTKYTARMDSDDICMPSRLEEQLKFFQSDENLVVCGTSILEFYEYNGKKIEKIRKYPSFTDSNSKTLYKGTPLAHPTVLIKTDILKKYKYDSKLKKTQDLDLWFRLIVDGYYIKNIETPLLLFRITDDTFKRRNISKAFAEYRIYSNYLFKLFGFSFLSIIPLIRFFSRLIPAKMVKKLYFSKTREKIIG